MIDHIKKTRLGHGTVRLFAWTTGWFAPMLLERRIFGAALIASLLAALYWGLIASDRYVSEAHVIVQRADIATGQSMDFGSLLGNLGGGSHTDQLLLRDYLLSVDVLKKLDNRLHLRTHYSDRRRDLLSRMWFQHGPIEWFYRYYLSRVTVDFDDYSGILVIKAQAYDAKTAHAIAVAMVEEGERFMNAMGHRLAQQQVVYLEKQVKDLKQRFNEARQKVLAFQNRHGMVSPEATATNLAAIINGLESQLADLQTRRAAMLGYLMPNSPNIVELNLQIAAIRKQIKSEKARLTSTTNKTLNSAVEEFQRLELNAGLAQDFYKTALTALESGRVEATRTLKKVATLQEPSKPQYPEEPRRVYNTVVFIIVAMLIAGLLHLIAAVIRDHMD